MKKNALITGASSGIGREFARVFAREGYALTLVARRQERLEQLKNELVKEYNVEVVMIPCDLSKPCAAESVYQQWQKSFSHLDVLVNNAGVGHHGALTDVKLAYVNEMIQLNVSALTELTRLFLPDMVKRRFGAVLNVASSAGFIPGSFMGVYYATKAFVVSLSEALAEELRGSGVSVTVLCPGPVKTEFQSVAYLEDPAVTLKRKIPTARQTAEYGFKAMQRQMVIAIPDCKNKLIPYLIRVLPRWLIRRLVRHAQLTHIAPYPRQ